MIDSYLITQFKAMIDAWVSGIAKLKKDHITIETDYDGKFWYIYELDDRILDKEGKKITQHSVDPIIISADHASGSEHDKTSEFIEKISSYIVDGFVHIDESESTDYYENELQSWDHEKYTLF